MVTVPAVTPEEGAPASKAGRRRKLVVVAAIALVLTLGLAIVRRRSLRQAAAPAAGVAQPVRAPQRRAVAVLDFANVSGGANAQWLATALAETMAMELGAGEQLRTIPGENVARMQRELGIGATGTVAAPVLARIGKNLGIDFVVAGSYEVTGEGAQEIALGVRAQETQHGTVIAQASERGTEAGLFDLVARLYAEGLARLRFSDAVRARELLELSAAADPGNALVHTALADAWTALGYDARALASAKRASELSSQLPREQRLAVEARYRLAARQWERAASGYRTLWRLFPDNLEYGLQLAEAESLGGKPQAALATVAAMAALPSPARDDPRIDLAEGTAATGLSDYRREIAAATRAAARAEAAGARILVARALLMRAWAQRNLGDLDAAVASAQQGLDIYETVDDRGGVAVALNMLATTLRQLGEVARARAFDEQSLVVFRDIGDRRRMSWALMNLARYSQDDGDLAGARRQFEQALAICREIGDGGGGARTLTNLALVLQHLGRFGEAERALEQALAAARGAGNRRAEGWALAGQAVVLEELGKEGAGASRDSAREIFLAIGEKRGLGVTHVDGGGAHAARGQMTAARRDYEQALRLLAEVGDRGSLDAANAGLGQLELASGDLAAARRRFEEVLESLEHVGDQWNRARVLLGLATVALEEGRAAPAEATAREAAAFFRRAGATDLESAAEALLTRALHSGGRASEALSAIQRATHSASDSESPRQRLAVVTAADTVRGMSFGASKAADAKRRLEISLTEANAAGLLPLELEIRLALGQIDQLLGNAAAAPRLENLERDAAARGFGLIARKARASLSSGGPAGRRPTS